MSITYTLNLLTYHGDLAGCMNVTACTVVELVGKAVSAVEGYDSPVGNITAARIYGTEDFGFDEVFVGVQFDRKTNASKIVACGYSLLDDGDTDEVEIDLTTEGALQ